MNFNHNFSLIFSSLIVSTILYIPKILTDEEVKDLVLIIFYSEYFKSTREKLNSKLGEDKNLATVLNHKKGLINIQNSDNNEYLKWSLVRYLNTADHHPTRIRKNGKDFARKLDSKDIKAPVKSRDIHKVEEKKCISISAFGYKNKEKFSIYVYQNTFKRNVDLLLIDEKSQYYLFLSKILTPSCTIKHYIVI